MSEQTPTKLAAADEADADAGDAPGARAHGGVVGVVGHSNQLNQPFFAGRRGDAAPGADAYAYEYDGGGEGGEEDGGVRFEQAQASIRELQAALAEHRRLLVQAEELQADPPGPARDPGRAGEVRIIHVRLLICVVI